MASMLLHGEYAQFNDSFNKKTAAILKTSKQETTTCKMIAPITGKFRKQVMKDIAIALTLGGVSGYVFWNSYHVPTAARRNAYYAKLEASKQ
ncbi:hypothetical protein G6F57_006166 [Rhizopus arrhizus]|nr:hypothetical protein G6F30_000399 [Rhizopus arrhizus]KAG1422522.1 hypothetical protein G6F58_003246 [Rhizopus delemar]KAG0980844.1 hypothetical protein G6F29_007514 [Rhizopus arrhizus]KAG0992951.1 hypothetical protein G6F28_007160 [Rhizopus arrhizus]KAG1011883.1 hypothetical protein G6F27_003337 [Rhizopus arrhizus]